MNRVEEILQVLLNTTGPITTKEVAKILNVSDKTIRNDLNKVEDIADDYHLKLIKKPRVGIWIEGSEDKKNLLNADTLSGLKSLYSGSTKDYRINFILQQLLEENRHLYLEHIAQQLYVSRSTVEKDLEIIAEWLKEKSLELLKDEGKGYFYVSGSESEIRKAIAARLSQTQYLSDELGVENNFYHKNYSKVDGIVQKWLQLISLNTDKTNIRNIAFHILIMVQRIQDGNSEKKTAASETLSIVDSDRLCINYLIAKIENQFSIIVDNNEKQFLEMHVIGMILDTDFVDENSDFIHSLRHLSEQIADDFIADVDLITNLGLKNNYTFRESLIIHLMPTVYRIQNDLNLYNPLLNEIKEQYSYIYELSKIIQSPFKKYLNTKVSNAEIAFIALHLSLAIDSIKESEKIAVICPMGKGVSRFLIVKLKESFPEITFLNYSVSDAENGHISNVDLVVSTVPLKGIDYVKVSGIVKPEDIKKIRKGLQLKQMKSREWFTTRTMHVFSDEIDKDAILKEMCRVLELNFIVDNKFYKGVLEREEMASTEIGDGIILTHGFQNSVNQSQLSFALLKHSIIWNEESVDFIVLIAMNEKDSKNVFALDWLYKMLTNKKVLHQIKKSNNIEELFDAISDGKGQI